ncbi:MAG: response regulator [Verrucomicrobiota bacterium]
MNQTIAHSAEGARIQRTALVVDDVDDMLDLLEIALNAADFRVLRASSAADAVDLFQSCGTDIDLLMTDLRVGIDSGIELAQRLISAKPSLQVLAISGFAIEGKVVTADGQIEFLPKPFSTSELKSKLNALFAPASPRLTVTVTGNSAGNYTVSTTCASPPMADQEDRTV